MPPKSVTATRKHFAALQGIADFVQSEGRWSLTGPYEESAVKLLRMLADLEASETPFVLVDAAIPFEERAARLMAWLGTHPDFQAKKLEIVNNLPAERGSRGVRVLEPVKKEETVFRVPQPCMVSTATARRTEDLGPLMREPQLSLMEMPTVALTLHVMVEHAKSLTAACADPLAVTVPVAPLLPLPADECADEEGACSGDHGAHGHSHGGASTRGGAHGHSHGGVPCGGHGHSHGGASSGGGHGHSHGGASGGGSHGHSHGGAGAAAGGGAHGHSHGGVPCGGHGHAHGGEGEKHTPLERRMLDVEHHPWGSPFRAYLAMLPEKPSSCLYFTVEQLQRLRGLPIQFDCVQFLRNSVRTFINLFQAFGPAGSLIVGFADYFTWAHFKWAITIVMSRQNRVPNPVDGDHDLALVPLYDMVNHVPGPITSFFFGKEQYLVLDAGANFNAGDELTMSYGGRDAHQLLQYQGFCGPLGESDYAQVEAALDGLESDKFYKIRANILESLFITPEHNAQRRLRYSVETLGMLRRLSATGGKEAEAAVRQVMWGLPFSFQVKADGTVSADLTTFLRVACISSKTEAAEALRQCDQARRAALTAREELMAKAAARRQKKLDARESREASAAHGHAHADGSACSGHGHAHGEAAPAADVEEEEDSDDEDVMFQLILNELAPENELAARAAAVLQHEIATINGEAPQPAGSPALAPTTPLPASDPVEAYRAQQLSILRSALTKARAAVEASDAALPPLA